MEHVTVFLLVSLVLFLGKTDAQNDNVNVTVYYESLCPYAKKFIVEQLHPVLEGNLSNYVNLVLIPYGKAETNHSGDNITFTCHHGEMECYGNLIQACSDSSIDPDPTSKLTFNLQRLRFISCFMGNLTTNIAKEKVDSALDECIKYGAYNTTADKLRECADSKFGKGILEQYGKLTDEFQKPLGNVPTIVYNGVFNKTESDNSEKDFKQVLCSKINGDKPIDCNSSTHLMTNITLLVFSVLMVISSTSKMI